MNGVMREMLAAGVLWGVAVGGVCAVARGQSGVTWEVRILHPAGAARSEPTSVDEFGTVTGNIELPLVVGWRAGYWGSTLSSPPTAASWTALTVNQGQTTMATGLGPEVLPGAVPGTAYIYGSATVSNRPPGQNPIAGYWNRATGVFVSMHPAVGGAQWSAIYGGRRGMQVGEISGSRAVLWRGTGASAVLLHPSPALSSRALATDGVRQAGYAFFPGGLDNQAVEWNGTAGSWTLLHQPTWYVSWALDIDGDQRVGFFRQTVSDPIFGPSAGLARPVLWRAGQGTPIDLMPTGSQWLQGEAFGVVSPIAGGAGIQVGSASLQDNSPRAVMWRGTAASMVNLHELLPAPGTAAGVPAEGWIGSTAKAVAGGGFRTYIVGTAFGFSSFLSQTILWIRTDNNLRCGPSDVAGPNQSIGPDGQLTADDIIVFLQWYFANDPRADVAGPNQAVNPDGQLTADDIIVFLQRYFAGC
jgi:hypothetical protein